MTITVKALQKTGPEEPFRVTEIDRRDVGPNDVLIEIRYAGICHSDIHTVREEWGPITFPQVVGHEIVGVVAGWDPPSRTTPWATASASAAW